MTNIVKFLAWFAKFDQDQKDKPVEFDTWSIPASVVIAQTLHWAFPKQEGDKSSGKELVAGYMLNPQHPIQINDPEDAAKCIVKYLLQPMKNKGKRSATEGLDPNDNVDRSRTFAGELLNRDGRQCVITRQVDRSLPKAKSDTNRVYLEGAHIFPSSCRAMGTNRQLIECFVAGRIAALVNGADADDARNGLAMQHDVHQDFDNFLFGLKWVAPNEYQVERINMQEPGLSFAVPQQTIKISRTDATGNPDRSLIQLHYHCAKLLEALRRENRL